MTVNRFVAQKTELVTALARPYHTTEIDDEGKVDWSELAEPVSMVAGVEYEAGVDAQGFAYLRAVRE
jgi:hypothetical protein